MPSGDDTLFSWHDRYALNEPEVDDQHRQLLELARLLHEALSAGRGGAVADRALTALKEYVDLHFRDEEEVFRRLRCSDLEHHRAEHQRLRQDVEELARDVDLGFDGLPEKLVLWVERVLVPHMVNDDQRTLASARGKPGAPR